MVCVTREERALPEDIRNAAKDEIFRRMVEKLMLLTMWSQGSLCQADLGFSKLVCLFICLGRLRFLAAIKANVDYHS